MNAVVAAQTGSCGRQPLRSAQAIVMPITNSGSRTIGHGMPPDHHAVGSASVANR